MPSEAFNYIHSRALLLCFRDPAFIVPSAFSVLRPAASLNFNTLKCPSPAYDNTMDGTHLQEWNKVVVESAAKLGRVVPNSKNYGRYMNL